MQFMKNSYDSNDVTMLLKDLTGEMKEMSAKERADAMRSGAHYSEMLPMENEPSAEYSRLYEKAMDAKAGELADEIATVSKMVKDTSNGDTPVLLSLARAGIPVGILIKRYLEDIYRIKALHFAISIIRDKGIDENAMEYVYEACIKQGIPVGKNIIFVDGWTGKGMIHRQLKEAVATLKEKDKKWDGITDDLYVLADPANITPYCGTHEDYMLPCCCLNSTCSGLISRTILNGYIGESDFHGAVFFEKFSHMDQSRAFVDTVSSMFKNASPKIPKETEKETGMSVVNRVCADFGVKDFKKVKPGIGETTRVLLRRVPHMVLLNATADMSDPDIGHILLLCREKGVSVSKYLLGGYKVCGIIKEAADV